MAGLPITKCPRCDAAFLEPRSAALSRVADVEICSRCGDREALYGRDGQPEEDWPLPLKTLDREEWHLLRRMRSDPDDDAPRDPPVDAKDGKRRTKLRDTLCPQCLEFECECD
jgi:hypothetical protein